MNNVYYLQIDIDDSDISLLKKVDSILDFDIYMSRSEL